MPPFLVWTERTVTFDAEDKREMVEPGSPANEDSLVQIEPSVPVSAEIGKTDDFGVSNDLVTKDGELRRNRHSETHCGA